MNPPAALSGAMSRERKPFTYTPGGLDLSQIKSERMAKRLMRNAMNQGVPELPPQIQSPPTPSTPIATPNFNCLPVQVFPTFQLPANPKSLLRTRSTPAEHKEPPTAWVTPLKPANISKSKGIHLKEPNGNASSISLVDNKSLGNRPASMYEYNEVSSKTNQSSRDNYGSTANTIPALPEISYDTEYFEARPQMDVNKENSAYFYPNMPDKDVSIIPVPIKDNHEVPKIDWTNKLILKTKEVPEPIVDKPVYVAANKEIDEDEQRGVRIVKKKKVDTQSQNGEQNGDADAELTVQIPTKKSAAKTETKVEVSKKTLPDGSIEETKTTTTRTTIDGKTEIKTKTEKTTTPKPEEFEEVEEVEEEEEESGDVVVQEVDDDEETSATTVTIKKATATEEPVEISSKNLTKNEERSESTSITRKRVVIVEESDTQEQEEEEVQESNETETVEVKKVEVIEESKTDQNLVKEIQEGKNTEETIKEETITDVDQKEEEEEEEEIEEEVAKKEVKLENTTEHEDEEIEEEEEEEYEEAEEIETEPEPKPQEPHIPKPETKKPNEDEYESEYTEEEYESEVEESPEQTPIKESKEPETETQKTESTEKEIKDEELKEDKKQDELKEEIQRPIIPLREPSIPLDKVEEVEIKPIGAATETIKTVKESTEIIKGPSDPSSGSLSTQAAYNRIENIITVNRTTKTLDNTYEQLTQQGIPTLKSYFAPDRERINTSPQPSKAYEPIFSNQPEPERRHSLLLERLSTERQMPSDIYQNQCSNRDLQRQWSQEPQSEVVNVSNVKPSTITNSQWFQQTKKETYNNISSSTQSTPAQLWNQPQPQEQPLPQAPPQQLQQQPPAPQYQQTQTQFQQPQPQYQQHQSSYLDNSTQISSNTYQKNSYTSSTPSYTPSYTPKPTNWAPGTYGNSTPSLDNQYSYQNKDSTDIYQKTSQQYSSGYVPPPWEQDPNYVAPELPTHNYYQTPSTTFSPSSNADWKPKKTGKFPKPAPTAYIPPAPNQSFVKPLNTSGEPPKLPGRKTYYSEYERRYISVPEATYVPADNKLQPNPSPQYYYDNTDPAESVEPQWRKELREFTEKSSQTPQPEQASVKPPWENDIKYAKAAPAPYTPTQSWSQTLRPQSYRERSFESEYVGSNEWSKTHTLGRGRPLSTYGNPTVETIPERTRGVSVDRYNPNNYQAPIASEHGPVPTHTLNAPVKGYHNPHVPGHHTRASVEPREQPVQYRQCEQRHSPLQSRSFKYLQWITGTDE